MLDSGNFVLYGKDSHTIWESFYFPTDTILGGQSLFDGDELVSSVSISDHSSGHYLLSMQMDGNLVAYPVNSLDDRNDAYWASGTYNEGSGVQLKLTCLGVLFLHYGLLEKKLILAKSSYPNKNGTTTIHRLTLDIDGIFRLYLHQFKSDNSSSMLIEWFALPNQREVGGFCGFNSYCSSRGSKAECKCYPGFNFINDSNKFLGCHEKFNEDDCIRSKYPAVLYNAISLQNLWWSDFPYSVMPRFPSGGRAQPKQSSLINLGSSLSYPTSWLSPSSQFAFGFYQQGRGFAVGIWFVGKDNTTIVWTANRDDPPVTSKSMLDITMDGKILLRIEQGQKQLIVTSATDPVSYAAMLDTGNFVLYDKDSKIIWQNFDYPTDTILGGQTLFTGGKPFSSLTQSDHSTGQFHLKMQPDGNLVLYPVTSEDTPADAYWYTSTSGNDFKFNLYLNDAGRLMIMNDTSLESFHTIYPDSNSYSSGINFNNNNDNTIYRATLDVDGVFRLYSHTYHENGNYHVSRLWSALSSSCMVNGFCGFNSFCTQDNNQSDCRCLPGHDFVDPNQRSLGCQRNFSGAGCIDGKENVAFYNISTMKHMTWGDTPYFAASMSREECSWSCLEDCNCGAALFSSNYCRKQKLPVRYVRRDKGGYTAFLKIGHKGFLKGGLDPK